MRTLLTRHSCTLLALILTPMAIGCGDNEPAPGDRNSDGSVEDGDAQGDGGLGAGDPDALNNAGGPDGPGNNGQDPKGLPGDGDDQEGEEGGALSALRSLVLIGAERIELTALQDVAIKALLIDGHGDPVEDEIIELTLLGQASGSTLSAPRSDSGDELSLRTDDDGQIRATLTAPEATASFVVRLRHELTEAIDIDVEITSFPEGDLLVNFRLPANSEAIQEVAIHLLPAIDGERDGDCIVADPNAREAERRSRVVGREEGEVLFQDLATGAHFRVEARGLNRDGAEIARACGSAGPIEGLTVVDIDIALELDALRFFGDPVRFDQDSSLAILDGLDDSLRAHLEDLAHALEEPASFFVRPITRLVPEDFGAPILPAGFARDAINRAAGIALEQYFRENVGDPAYERFDLAAAELLNVLSQVGVRSQLTLENTARGRRLDATSRWSHLVLTSELFCHPDPPAEDCDTVIIPLEGEAKLGVQAEFESTWDPEAGDYSSDEYDLDLDFRALFHVIFKQTLLPAILGDPDVTTIAQIMERLVNCDRIGALIAGALGDPVLEMLLTPFTTGFCRDGVYGWGRRIDEEIDALDGSSSVLHMQETAVLADRDGDRVLDTFANGVQDARWIWDGVDGNPFLGSFTATTRR